MNAQGNLYQVSLYIRGDFIDPQRLTEALNASPTDAYKKGDTWFTSAGSKVIAKTGVWSLAASKYSTSDSFDFGELMDNLKIEFAAIKGFKEIEEAYVDLFIATDLQGGGGSECALNFSASDLDRLANLGLPFQVTFSLVGK